MCHITVDKKIIKWIWCSNKYDLRFVPFYQWNICLGNSCLETIFSLTIKTLLAHIKSKFPSLIVLSKNTPKMPCRINKILEMWKSFQHELHRYIVFNTVSLSIKNILTESIDMVYLLALCLHPILSLSERVEFLINRISKQRKHGVETRFQIIVKVALRWRITRKWNELLVSPIYKQRNQLYGGFWFASEAFNIKQNSMWFELRMCSNKKVFDLFYRCCCCLRFIVATDLRPKFKTAGNINRCLK